MTTRTRTGFTLIELLVVIALLAVLAALSAGTYFRIRNTQQIAATESTLQKLNTGIERIYGGVRDQADKEFASGVLPYSNSMEKLLAFSGGPNQRERARALWLYFRIKNEFPQTFNEVKSAPSASLADPPGSPNSIITLPFKQAFRTVVTVNPAYNNPAETPPTLTEDDYNLQAAALLYLILTEKSSRGESFDEDPLKAVVVEKQIRGVPVTATQTGMYKVFVDSWGTPITFCRFFTHEELNNRPYAKFNFSDIYTNPNMCNNPVDPTFRLFPTRTTNGVTETWSKFNTYLASTGIPADSNAGLNVQIKNWLPTAISAGPNKSWDKFDVRGDAPLPFNSIGYVAVTRDSFNPLVSNAERDEILQAAFKSDNILGFRLRQFGNRGD